MSDDEEPGDLLGAPDGEVAAEVEAAVEAEAEEERLELHGWDGEVVDAADAMLDRALAYGMYVNKGRALPDVRDGLKPVQRRILHSMDEIGARAGRPYVKSAGVVGHVIANYHPHGDSAIYDAMVRMAQPFSLNVPLVDGQGNWGTVGPKEYSDPPAAYRYCVTADARVRLASGATPRIGDLVPGAAANTDTPVDLCVLGADGEPVHASLLFHSGDHPTLRLRTREGFEVTGTANHPRARARARGRRPAGARLAHPRGAAARRPGGALTRRRRRRTRPRRRGARLAARGGGGGGPRGGGGARRRAAGRRVAARHRRQAGVPARLVRGAGRLRHRRPRRAGRAAGPLARPGPGRAGAADRGRRRRPAGPRHRTRAAARGDRHPAGRAGVRARGRVRRGSRPGAAARPRAPRRAARRAAGGAAAGRTGPGRRVRSGAGPAARSDVAGEATSRAARLDYATVEAIESAGVRPVYSLRVDSDDHAFVANALVNHNTEARLTGAASDWLADLRPEVVEFRPNFTEKRDEPWVLPVGFPNLLVNGSKGIGWSMACEVPPHNLAEACEAAILLAEEPDAPLEALLERLPGPDFPTGGIVVNPEALAEAYERGQGTFRLQARFHVEQLPGNQQAIVVTELPYGVSPDQVVAEVVKAARAERIQDVTELPKNLSDRSGLRVQIRLKRGGDATRLVADLMRHTSLRVSVGINMTVLVDGVPRLVSLRDALDHFVQFRFDVVTRRLVHERDVLLRELHRLVALLAALDAIDEVVRIVRGAEDDDDAREQLEGAAGGQAARLDAAVPIDDEQAQWILDMPLKRLSRLNRLRLVEERKTKGARVDEIARILESHDELRTIVVRELSQTASALRRAAAHDARRRGAARRGARRQARDDRRRAAAHRDLGLLDGRRGRAAWPRATRIGRLPGRARPGRPAAGAAGDRHRGRPQRLRRGRHRVPRAGRRAARVGPASRRACARSASGAAARSRRWRRWSRRAATCCS